MNNKKLNSIEWLYDQMSNLAAGYATELNQQEILEKAKAMHKEETIKLYYAYEDYVLREEGIIKTFGQFYNETYGGNK